MTELIIRTFQTGDEADVIALWQQCGLIVPWNNPEADIARNCADSPELFFLGCVGNSIVASCMAGYDGHRGWIYFVAVANAQQRQGIATRLVRHAETQLRERGCPKIDLMVRNTNEAVIAFYKSIGYGDDPVVVLSKRLSGDQPHVYNDD